MPKPKIKVWRKGDVVRFRVTTEQKRLMASAASRAGLSLSAWLLSLAIREARGA